MSSNVFFTADTHLGHCRILQYCNRPFRDHDHMNTAILERFCEVLRPGDTLYHLGDVCHSEYDSARFFGSLPTKQIHLIYGNHDKPKLLQHPFVRSYADLKRITIDKISVLLCHYAMRSWPAMGRGGFQLYGHSHGRLPGVGRQMDVGVDTNNFYPYEWSEIKKRLEKIPYGFDHEDQGEG